MRYTRSMPLLCLAFLCAPIDAQTYSGTMVTIPGGTAMLGMAQEDFAAPPPFDAPLHTATLSSFKMGAYEVTNGEYVAFLNDALDEGLIEVRVETARGPDEGFTLVYGTSAAPEEYREQAIINLSGTRVMKDHDNADGDDDPFTGAIEPENPLNICYIGYDETRPAGARFYVKDPADPADFDWMALTTYHNYTSETRRLDTSETLNDYDAWSELADFPAHMPTLEAVTDWPATFIRWYGAKAFALYYGLDLPTEAEWEYGAQGGAEFAYATDDGSIRGDGTSAVWNHLGANPSLGHVADVRTGNPNPYGLYNMAGNVWEWVDDWYAADFYQDATDPRNDSDSGLKVRRGGSWNYHQFTLHSAARAKDEQFKGNDHFGFRVVDRNVATLIAPEQVRKTLPTTPHLQQNYPNPFNSSTAIRFHLFEPATVRVEIFDIGGQRVQSLISGYYSPGAHEVLWNGRNQRGVAVATGLYLVRLSVGDFTAVEKMMLMK